MPEIAEQLLWEGKAKRVYATADPAIAVVHYTDRATAFNGAKRAEIDGKGMLNNEISARFMMLLAERGIANHLVEQIDAQRQLVRLVDIVPLEVVTRNVVAGSLAGRTGLPEGHRLAAPIVEFYYKRDDLGDPLLTRAHIAALGLAEQATLDALEQSALAVNATLDEVLSSVGITLVDFKLEYGFARDTGELLLADEISPDTCRFWDTESGRVLDKDRFRRDMGDVEGAYAELLERLPVPATVATTGGDR